VKIDHVYHEINSCVNILVNVKCEHGDDMVFMNSVRFVLAHFFFVNVMEHSIPRIIVL
jgi:hypothetical protein